MMKIYTILAAIMLTSLVFAQAPEKISYQAVVRNTSDQLVANQAVGMRISILQNAIDSEAIYVETQSPTTNVNGLLSIEIGSTEATNIIGDFSTIEWANNSFFIKTEIDPTELGGQNYSITGISQLISVPYALHAKTAESITGTLNETDPEFTSWDKTTGIIITENQISDLSHTTDTDTHIDSTGIASFGFVAGAHTIDTDTHLSEAEVDDYVANNGYLSEEVQELQISDYNLSISGGNTVVLTNKIQFITRTEMDTLTPINGQLVYNTTNDVVLMWGGSNWIQISDNCFPQPTIANAGDNQYFTLSDTSATLSANTPIEGTGTWSVIDGIGGVFEDVNNPNTVFSGNNCTLYKLQWTIATACSQNIDSVEISFFSTPTSANAGPNKTMDSNGNATLSANTPINGVGEWSLGYEDPAVSFGDINDPSTPFSGNYCQGYDPVYWEISTVCATSRDELVIFDADVIKFSNPTTSIEILSITNNSITVRSNITTNSYHCAGSVVYYFHDFQYSTDENNLNIFINGTNGSSVTKTITGLSSNTEYFIHSIVRATDGDVYGTNVYSDTISFTTDN